MTEDTQFKIASISKVFTSYAIMQLVDAGRLDLDEPVNSYLTQWQVPSSEYDANKVTLRTLLCHTSGLSGSDATGYTGDNIGVVLLAMFKKLRPHESRKEFFKTAFSGKIKAIMLLLPPIILATASILSVWLIAVFEGKPFTSMFSTGSYSFGMMLILSLLSGPTGEEAGWRGFLRVELAKKYSF